MQRRSVRTRAQNGVRVEVAAAGLGSRADRVDVLVGMDCGDRLALGLRRLTPLESKPPACLELRLDRGNARLVLGMRAGVVLERARMVEIERRTDLGTVIRP